MNLGKLNRPSLNHLFYHLVFLYIAYASFQVSRLVFASNDDIYAAFAAYQNQNIFSSGLETANWTGRFYQALIFPVWEFPYHFFQSPDAIRMLRFTYTFAYLSILFLSIYKLLGRRLGLSFIFVFTIFSTFFGSYNALNSFMFWYSASTLIVLFASLELLKALRDYANYRSHARKAIFLHFLACLTYEVYLLIPFFYYCIILLNRTSSLNCDIKKVKRYFFFLYALSSTVYLMIYFGFKAFSLDSYDASRLGSLSASRIVPSLVSLTLNYFPKQSIFDLTVWNYLTSRTSIWFYLFLVFFLLLSCAYCIQHRDSTGIELDANSSSDQTLNGKDGLTVIALLIAQAFVFNLPLSLSERYQSLGFQKEPYVSTLQSYIFILIAVALSLSFIEKKFQDSRFILRRFLLAVVISFSALLGSFVNLTNIDQYNLRSYYSSVWYLAEDLIPALEHDSNIVVSSSLENFARTIPYRYWDERFTHIRGSVVKLKRTASVEDSLRTKESLMEFFPLSCGIVGVLVNPGTSKMYLLGNCKENTLLKLSFGSDANQKYLTLNSPSKIQEITLGGSINDLVIEIPK